MAASSEPLELETEEEKAIRKARKLLKVVDDLGFLEPASGDEGEESAGSDTDDAGGDADDAGGAVSSSDDDTPYSDLDEYVAPKKLNLDPFTPVGHSKQHFLPDAGPFERFHQEPTTLRGHKKFFPDSDPLAVELSNKNIEPSKHVMDSALQSLAPAGDQLNVGYSLELGRRAVEKAENHVRDEFAEGFRVWLADNSGLPKRSGLFLFRTSRNHTLATNRSDAQKRTIALVGKKSLKLGELPGVASYLDSFVDAQVAFEKKLVALIMNGPKNLEDSYMYYKYIVLKQKPEPAEIAAMFSPAF